MCNGSAAASITLRDAVQLISGCDTGNDADVKIHRKKKIAVLLLYMLYLVEMLAGY